jgi:hypothetical protein
MSDQTQGSRQGQEEDNTSTIPQPEGQDPIEGMRPSQAEGDRDTVEDDLRGNGGQDQG